MANIRKTFNFRNGVQVDEDNLIVNSFGLVGIGTSVPTELLDVRGTAKIVGLVTATEVSSSFGTLGVATITSLRVGGNISINAGVVTATSGVATFYGDGSGLINIPTSQWIDIDTGLGFTSIYAAGFVGVSTNFPYYPFQVGGKGNLSNFTNGVGIGSEGNILATGIITATTFSGSLNGNVNGNINSGVGTFGNLNIGTVTINSGIVTATTFRGTLIGNVTGTASTALSLSGTPNITVGTVTASKIVADLVEVPNTGVTTISKLLHIGTGGTAFAALESGRIGVGTAVPTSDLQIRKNTNSLLEVISNSGQSRISIGQVTGVGKSTGVLRFGNTDKTFDIINNDTGNINMYLHAGPSGVGTGRFAWFYGQSFNELASLTYEGNLGLGKTNPENTLHVVGTSTVTGNAFFGSNVTILGNLNAVDVTLPPLITNTNIINSSGVSEFFDLNVNQNLTANTIGIGTTLPISDLDARDQNALIGILGINTSTAKSVLDVSGVALFESIGIGTTNPENIEYEGISVIDRTVGVHDTAIVIKNTSLVLDGDTLIGIGTTVARSVIDFSDAGGGYPQQAFMLPPRLTNAQIAGLSTVAGAFIFNLDSGKFQGYTGIAWTDFH